MPEHWLHIYQRPVQGDRFLGRWPVYEYQHRIAAIGGFDTADCQIAVDAHQAERFLQDYLGCRVAVFVDNPGAPIWEGWINRLTINIGTVAYSRSMDQMFNRVTGVYTNGTGGATTHQTQVNNLTSQAIYGIKEGSPEDGISRTTSTAVSDLRDRILSKQSYPLSSLAFNDQAGVPLIQLQLKGFYWWLEWQKFAQANAANTAVSTFLGTMVTNYNNTTFIDTANYDIETNTKTRIPIDLRDGNNTFWGVAQKMAEAGDGTNAFVSGISPTRQDGTRRFYYRTANTDVEYSIRSVDGQVRDAFGRPVKPWLVQPDRVIRVDDILLGSFDSATDPRTMYLDKVDYRANGLGVQMASRDDLSAEGAFQLRFKYKLIGDRFGALERTI